MLHGKRLLGPLLFIVSGLIVGEERPDPSSQETPIFRTEVHFIEVDAIVVDGEGHFVRDLRQDEFEVLEDGMPQDIATFRLVDVPSPSRVEFLRGRVEPIEPDIRTNEGASEGRLYVLVLDDLHIAAERSSRVREVAREFITRWVGPNDWVAVTHTSGRLDASCDFTNDRSTLLAAVDRFMGRGLRPMTLEKIDLVRQAGELGRANPDLQDMVVPQLEAIESQHGHQARQALAHIRSISERLQRIEGRRKALVLISEGMSYDVGNFDSAAAAGTVLDAARDAIGAAGVSNVAIYGLDVRGLGSGQDELVNIPDMPSSWTARLANIGSQDPMERRLQELLGDRNLGSASLAEEIQRGHDSLRGLSSETGGFAVVNTADPEAGLERIARDNNQYYLLGYYPDGDLTDSRFRRIEVHVKRPGLSLRARKGYIPSKRVSGAAPGRRFDSVGEVLTSPLPVTDLPIRVFAAPMQLARAKVLVPVVIEASIEGFGFEERDGTLNDEVDVSTLALDEHGVVGDRKNTTFNLALRPELHRRMTEDGFRSMVVLELPPAEYELRVGVYEKGAGLAGSAFYPISVPDPSELAMGALVLCSTKNDAIPIAAAREDRERINVAPSTRRRFTADDELFVYAELSSPRRDGVDVRTTIRGMGDEVVYQAENEHPGSAGGRVHLVHHGRYDLSRLAPGGYVVEVEARERNGSVRTTRKSFFEIIDSPVLAEDVPGMPPRYHEPLELYRGGRLDEARRLLAGWTDDAVGRGATSAAGVQAAKAAVLLHTEVAVEQEWDLTDRSRELHFEAAEKWLERIPDERRFRRNWLLSAAYYFHAADLSAANDYLKKAVKEFPDDTEILLAAGSTYEIAVWLEGDRGKLNDAEEYYREALAVDPDVAEAHLRLGRVLMQRGEKFDEEADRELHWVASRSQDTYLLYLADLFLGDLHLRRGELDDAIASYRAAVSADPLGQAACLSLSRALWVSGERPRAREVALEALRLPVSAPDNEDGHRVYLLGQHRLLPDLLDRMRREVLR